MSRGGSKNSTKKRMIDGVFSSVKEQNEKTWQSKLEKKISTLATMGNILNPRKWK